MRSAGPARRPRLLHVVGDSALGGAAVVILDLGTAAAAAGYEVAVLTSDEGFRRATRAAGLRVLDADVIRRRIRPWDVIGLVRLYRLLRQERFTVVHTHTSKAGFVGRLAARLAGVPVVVHTVHGFAFHDETSPRARAAVVLLERLAARWCDRIVTVSEYHRALVAEHRIAPEGKVLAIPNGIRPQRVAARDAAAARGALGLGAGHYVVLFSGRLAPQKGLPDLLNAWVEVASSMPEARLLLAGDGPLRSDLEEAIARSGLAGSVRLLGFREDVDQLLAAADAVVLPSLREGMSIALLEAMAAGLPLVATSIGSNREVTSDGASGLLVPPRDPSALATGLLRLGGDPGLRASLGAHGRARFESAHTAERMTRAYLDVYAELGVPAPVVADASVTLRAAHRGDLPDIVALHREAFAGFTMTRLGPRFLHRYYAAVLHFPARILVVAEAGGRVVGFAAGFTDPAGFYATLRRRRLRLALAAAPGLLCRPRLLPAAAASLRGAAGGTGDGEAELASLAVAPGAAGEGIGSSLVEAFCTSAAGAGSSAVTLSTDEAGNRRVRDFYERLGFVPRRRFERRPSRAMIEYQFPLHRRDG